MCNSDGQRLDSSWCAQIFFLCRMWTVTTKLEISLCVTIEDYLRTLCATTIEKKS